MIMCSTCIFVKLSSRPSAFSYLPSSYRGLYFKATVTVVYFVGKIATDNVADGSTIGAKTSSKEREAPPGLRNPGPGPVQKNDCIPLETNEAGSTHCFFGKSIL